MRIDKEKCIGCGACGPYCPVEAIVEVESGDKQLCEIVEDECVECGVCLRAEACPRDALFMPELQWPRTLRAAFSNPRVKHQTTGEGGRGTEEMKTNDVTGRFPRGVAGVAVEMGRPGAAARFRDLEKVAMAVARLGVEFEVHNPVTALIEDRKTGKMREDVLDEKVLSAILEFSVSLDRLKEALSVVKEAAARIDTLFSLAVISRADRDGVVPAALIAREAGFVVSPNTKTNVGLGRPLKEV